MATLEFIQKRISGKEKEIDKLTKKLARIKKAEAGGWEENNPYLYSESDLRWCLKDLEKLNQKGREHADWWNRGGWNDPNRKAIDKEYNDLRAAFQAQWGFILPYVKREQNPNGRGHEMVFDLERLNKDLDEEANRKYDFIIERTTAIVGEITDASALSVGAKGDLNGYIIGKKGRAKVQTIGAGGYNIQCFHFRTLINAA